MPYSPPTTVASKAQTGYLGQFLIGSPLTAIAELKSFKLNTVNVPKVNVSTLVSPGNTAENIPGMIEPETIEVSGNFTGDASQLQFLTLAKAQTVFAWAILAGVQTNTKTYNPTGNGFVSKYEVGPFENSKPVEFTATIQLAGAVAESVS